MGASHAKKTIRLLRNQEFRNYILTRYLVIFSLFTQTTAVSYLIYTLTADPLSLGFMGLAELIPAFGFAFFAGYFVDKREKKTVYLYCISAYIINTLILVLVTSAFLIDIVGDVLIVLFLYVSMFINGTIRAFLAPASFSLLSLLVKKEEGIL
jgi:hypothetical protein